ncbi:MAG: helix-turn-helix domain-containing protein [Vallitalea sp.]|jgi:transposase|nr:helix-turn-helix domain-containing protein [Vallitalea sp.]
MKVEGFNSHNKYMILKHALKENNVSQTCKLFGISRTTYYNWKKAYQKHGMIGLEVKEPTKPNMPNKVNKKIEHEILSYVERFPEDGPKRIYYELKTEGTNIGVSGIYNVLKRHNLTKKNQRVEYSRNKDVRFYVNKKNNNPKLHENIDKNYPGNIVIQRIDYIGTYEGIGKIYQYSIYDTYSKWCAVKIYNKKQDIDIWNFFELKLGYLMNTIGLSIENLYTEKNREFIPYFVKNNKYKEIINNFNFNHMFIESDKSTIIDEINDFNKILVNEFYSKIPKEKNIDSFIKVECSLHKFIRNYNFSRKITSGCNKGEVPAKVILESISNNNVDIDALPLWILTLFSSIKRRDKNE